VKFCFRVVSVLSHMHAPPHHRLSPATNFLCTNNRNSSRNSLWRNVNSISIDRSASESSHVSARTLNVCVSVTHFSTPSWSATKSVVIRPLVTF